MNTKTWLLCLCALLGGYQISQASSQYIICGDQPGEIYLTGVCSGYVFFTAFYSSSDAGQTLAPLDSIDPDLTDCLEYGLFSKDVTANTFHRFRASMFDEPGQYLTRDDGLTWELVQDTLPSCIGYATGVISGEIYCVAPYPIINHIQETVDQSSDGLMGNCLF